MSHVTEFDVRLAVTRYGWAPLMSKVNPKRNAIVWLKARPGSPDYLVSVELYDTAYRLTGTERRTASTLSEAVAAFNEEVSR